MSNCATTNRRNIRRQSVASRIQCEFGYDAFSCIHSYSASPEPVQAPLQPVNVEPVTGVAVRVTGVSHRSRKNSLCHNQCRPVNL